MAAASAGNVCEPPFRTATGKQQPAWLVCTKNHIRIGNVMESPKLAE
jgi:hypothetical protein